MYPVPTARLGVVNSCSGELFLLHICFITSWAKTTDLQCIQSTLTGKYGEDSKLIYDIADQVSQSPNLSLLTFTFADLC